ncbi:hypothetical protein [Anoxybacillus sp. J5B_2022]|uniref:hypothetical protein n=1 Tax=Anoxybacillus sp. J5B_2022 TaxID=3003246 RepID=UPI0022858052|nr:hypothetical protein [Anoxybacillus sp. J5B_2022]MCZ0755892.1 hypothetical protein [Anoxybacillus sp. J5B_2022]
MKFMAISFLIPILLVGIAIIMNLLLGMDIYRSVIDIFNPFKVMEPMEMGILFFVIGLWGVEVCVHWFRKKTN